MTEWSRAFLHAPTLQTVWVHSNCLDQSLTHGHLDEILISHLFVLAFLKIINELRIFFLDQDVHLVQSKPDRNIKLKYNS